MSTLVGSVREKDEVTPPSESPDQKTRNTTSETRDMHPDLRDPSPMGMSSGEQTMLPSSDQSAPSREATNTGNQANISTRNRPALLRFLKSPVIHPTLVTRPRPAETNPSLSPDRILRRSGVSEGGQREANEVENARTNTHFESQVSTISHFVLLSKFSDLQGDVDIIAVNDLEPTMTTAPPEEGLKATAGEPNAVPEDKGEGTLVDDPGNTPTRHPPAQQRAQPPATAGEPGEKGPRDDDHISSHPNRPETGKDSTLSPELKKGPRARIQDFRYNPPSKPYNDKSLKEAISSAAAEILSNLKKDMEARSSSIPLVFIAIGFGCLIVQELIALINEGSILKTISCVIFFHVPAISKEHCTQDGEIALNLPPPSTTRRPAHMKWSKAINSWDIWKKFHTKIKEEELSTVWFYEVADGSPKPTATSPQAAGVNFVQLIQNSTYPTDPVTLGSSVSLDPLEKSYLSFVSEIKRCLILTASTHREFDTLLEKFISDPCDLDARDDKKRCLLHRAVECSNDIGLRQLIAKRPNLISCQDQAGLTPLHSAVKIAVAITEDEDKMRSFQLIIGALLDALDKNQLSDAMEDQLGKSPWDYIRKNSLRWIKELKDDRILSLRRGELIYGAQVAQPEILKDMIAQANVGNSKQVKTCRDSNALLTQFYIQEEEDDSKDSLIQLRYSIYKAIYDRELESRELFEMPFPLNENTRATCKWIHLPANNERWVHDLFLRQFRCNDDSTRTRRHQGSALFGRHLDTGVQEYSQTRSLRSKQPPHGAPSNTITSAEGAGICKRTVTALFMPVFGFETYGNRRKLRKAMEKVSAENDSSPPPTFESMTGDDTDTDKANADEDNTAEVDNYNENLVRAYFKDKKFPLHCRRTLDQLTYHMLHDTEAHDSSQVMFKWQKEKEEQEKKEKRMLDYPLLMIDQLWLWILEDEQTVITSFPNIWDPSTGDYSLIRHMFVGKLKSSNRRQLINSAMDLANLIIQGSIDVLKREGPCGATIYDSFRSKINSIAAQHDVRFREFNDLVDELHKEGIDQQEKANLTNTLFERSAKTDHLAEIMEVTHELGTIQQVFSKQKGAVEAFAQAADQQHTVGADKNCNTTDSPQQPSYNPLAPKRNRRQTRLPKFSFPYPTTAQCHDNQDKDPGLNSSEQAWENLHLVNSNIDTIRELEKQAERVRVEIEGLLSRMQMQANAWEARFAREGSEHTQYQSNITLVFTIVTVFFLPLSFLSSVFAIQVDSYPHDEKTGELNWPVRDVMGLLFGISFVVILLIAVLGFRIHSIARFVVANVNRVSRFSSKWVQLQFLHWNQRETANTDTVWWRPELNDATLATIPAQITPVHLGSASSITGSWGSGTTREEKKTRTGSLEVRLPVRILIIRG
ncbi:hypothetical protein F4678DRAFT_457396 [Xylaria arbuscula]|nr:hypothetical protein F4678DRAFT_457396 [Xylaria arbuscula]